MEWNFSDGEYLCRSELNFEINQLEIAFFNRFQCAIRRQILFSLVDTCDKISDPSAMCALIPPHPSLTMRIFFQKQKIGETDWLVSLLFFRRRTRIIAVTFYLLILYHALILRDFFVRSFTWNKRMQMKWYESARQKGNNILHAIKRFSFQQFLF